MCSVVASVGISSVVSFETSFSVVALVVWTDVFGSVFSGSVTVSVVVLRVVVSAGVVVLGMVVVASGMDSQMKRI